MDVGNAHLTGSRNRGGDRHVDPSHERRRIRAGLFADHAIVQSVWSGECGIIDEGTRRHEEGRRSRRRSGIGIGTATGMM